MNVVVCVKRVVDPEMPISLFRIDRQNKRVVTPEGKGAFTINPYDEVAVEAGIKIKKTKGGRLIVVSLGAQSSIETIRHCLAMGADDGILLSDPLFGEEDRSVTAYVLATAIQKIAKFDLVLCGRQEADWDSGQVGFGIAEVLGIPCVGPAKNVEVANDNKIIVDKITDIGFEVAELSLPALVTVSSELCLPHSPNIKGVMAALKKKINIWSAEEIGADPSRIGPAGAKVKMVDIYVPTYEGRCELIEAETPGDAAIGLFERLREENLI
jgi:electron transfer flavoprotein beta subunit